MKNKLVDIVCLCAVGVIFGGTALWNLIQPNRPTISETEKRTLAAMPELTVSSLTDGSYFAGVSAFVSDTFVERDRLVSLSKKMDTLKGFDYSLNGEDNFVLLGPAEGPKNQEAEDPDTSDAIDAFFASLLNPTEESGNPADGEEKTEPVPPATDPTPAGQGEEQNPSDAGEPSGSGSEPDGGEGQQDANLPEIGTGDSGEDGGDETEAAPTDPDIPEQPDEPGEGSGGEGSEENSEGSGTDAEPEEPVYEVKSLKLSKETINLTVGSGTVLYAYAASTDPAGAIVHWSNSDKSVATISINPSGGIDVKAVGPGTAEVACTADDFRVVCKVNVSELTVGVDFTPPSDDVSQSADFLPDGLFIYGDGVYTQAFYSPANANWYAQTAAAYAKLFGCRVSVVVAPVSSMVIDNPNVKAKISDQGDILSKMRALCDASVNFVDTYTPLYEHRDEYLFFRTDHHWTQRGAYYAYTAFAESLGMTPTPLSFFEFKVHQDEYHGSMDLYTSDERVSSFKDSVEVFYPTKQNTMTLTDKKGKTWQYSSCINNNSGYLCLRALRKHHRRGCAAYEYERLRTAQGLRPDGHRLRQQYSGGKLLRMVENVHGGHWLHPAVTVPGERNTRGMKSESEEPA